jgi:REP element-mobilizing transposase RayT
MCHLVFPAKYIRVVFDEGVDDVLKEVCLGLEQRYEVKFLEIGTDKDHVHFLVQSVPSYSVTKVVRIIKSVTARESFKRCPQVKKRLWGGEFWTDGYFSSTVGKHGDEGKIGKYVKNQGDEYQQLHSDTQLGLLEVQVLPQADHGERSEAQLHEGDQVWEGSVEHKSRADGQESHRRRYRAGRAGSKP